MDLFRVGDVIAEKRKAKQMTQQELANRLHISNKTVSKWESGRSLPDVSFLPPLAQALDCTTAELLREGGSGEKTAASGSDPQVLPYLADRECLRYRIAKTVFVFTAAVGVLIDLVVADNVRLLLGCLLALLSLAAYMIAKAIVGTHMKVLDRLSGEPVERPSDRHFLLGVVWLWLFPFVYVYTQLGWWFFGSDAIFQFFVMYSGDREADTIAFLKLWAVDSLLLDIILLTAERITKQRRQDKSR